MLVTGIESAAYCLEAHNGSANSTLAYIPAAVCSHTIQINMTDSNETQILHVGNDLISYNYSNTIAVPWRALSVCGFYGW